MKYEVFMDRNNVGKSVIVFADKYEINKYRTLGFSDKNGDMICAFFGWVEFYVFDGKT